MAAAFTIDVRSNIKQLIKNLDAFAEKQVPFATASALTAVARLVADAEKKEIAVTFPTATPFTINSVAVTPARKGFPVALVFMRDIAATYLEPFVIGGVHHLNSNALLNPKNIGLNAYGNLPKGKLAQLRGRTDVFIGAVKTKSGQTINGVWQRPYVRPAGSKRGKNGAPKLANTTGHLKLLIRFGDALPVKQHLPWRETAQRVVGASLQREFSAAMQRAMATAKP